MRHLSFLTCYTFTLSVIKVASASSQTSVLSEENEYHSKNTLNKYLRRLSYQRKEETFISNSKQQTHERRRRTKARTTEHDKNEKKSLRINEERRENEGDTERVIVRYSDDDGYRLLKSVAKKIYHDIPKYNLAAAEIDAYALVTLATGDGIYSIEPDTVWKEQGIQEKILTASELDEYLKQNPRLLSSSPNSGNRNLLDLSHSEKVPYGITMTQADQITYGFRSFAAVCVVDTGALISHPDLDKDLVNGVDRTSKASGAVLQWNNDVRGHGTHIAGTISAISGNNYGVRGMGQIPTYITRGLDNNGNARESDIVDAMTQCEEAGAKVISLSLAGSSMSSSLKSVIDRLYDIDIMVVAASGNNGKRLQSFPASYEKVISVGAVSEDETIWSNSNYGPWVELTAPGNMVLSTGLYRDGEYQFAIYSGTSMATPHVSAAVALLWSHHPECSATQIRYALAYTAKDMGTVGCDDYYGFGIVQVKNALDFLDSNNCRMANWGQSVGSGQCSAVDVPPTSNFVFSP